MNEQMYSSWHQQDEMRQGRMTHEMMHDFCKRHRHHYVMMETNDGGQVDGIIYKVDDDNVDLLIPEGDMQGTRTDERFGVGVYGFGGYGYPGYGYAGGYRPRVPYRFRRFRRYRYPFFRVRRFFFPFFY